MRRFALILILLIGPAPPAGGECRAEEPAPAPPRARPSLSLSWWAAAGNFDGNDNPGQLEDERAQYALAGGLGWQIRPAFAIEFELLLYGADYDAPPVSGGLFTIVSDEYNLESAALLGTARLGLPKGPLRPYGSVGAGLFYAELIRYASTFGFPGKASEHDLIAGLSLAAGADIKAGRRSFILIEYRRLLVDGDFGAASGGDVDIGGTLALIGYRRRF